MNIMSRLKTWNMHPSFAQGFGGQSNKRVLLRADLNLPIKDGIISNDYRLQALLPTIDYVQKNGGKIILITHIGRPKKPTESLSTKLLIPLFEQKGYKVTFSADVDDAYAQSLHDSNTIILLENLRFFPGENSGDKQFAQQLSRLGDFYVDDAFGTLHRHDTSITLVPRQFDPSKRSIGLLVEKELEMLNKLISAAPSGFVLILGGGKVTDKLPLLEYLIDHVQDILLCPAIVFTFLASQGVSVGKSLVDNEAIALCQKLLDKAKKNKVTIHFPVDYQVALNSLDGQLINVDARDIPANAIGVSIGPKTIEQYVKIINNARTLFFNAAMGFEYRRETLQGTFALLRAIGASQGFRVVGGGNSVADAQIIQVDKEVDFVSTGGGATLAYLSGQQLPGLVALE